MKILEFPNYITVDKENKLSRNRTGYGYMTFEIATSIAKKDVTVDLLTQSYITKEYHLDNVKILQRKWIDILVNIKFKHFVEVIKTLYKYPGKITKLPKIIFYHLSMGYFEKLIKKNQYNLVHIHGIGYYTLPILKSCLNQNQKFVVTLHGLNSFSNSINISESGKRMEKDFLAWSFKRNIPVTVISTGIKKTILRYLSIDEATNFTVITNGFNFASLSKQGFDIYKKYNIDRQGKIMLSIGNIGRNKNQVQIIKAFDLLPKKIKEELFILFYGFDTKNSTFQKELSSTGWSSHLIYCGNVPKDELAAVYQQSNFVILASISEGFGLSLIEGFSFGLPCITFADIDAVEDIYIPDACCLVQNRSDAALAKGISEIIHKDWNKDKIKKHAEKFTLEKMADAYIQYFNKIV